ncbi:estradiol 17-beta-dehydrogenase 11-like [Antedon mediterranea]|uniref:estradiol 17-beta-dehydrogenase 11-like n=1 Tax=Antedon mediterranea TaxID=105859 RepID=UPI003AF8DBA1
MFVLFQYLVTVLRVIFATCEGIYGFFKPSERKNVAGETVLITGAGQGMGRLYALHFAKLGAKVVLWDINKEGNEKTESEVKEMGGDAYAVTVDVRRKEQVYDAAKVVKSEVGKVDILINNAGVFSGESICKLTDEQIVRTFEVNTLSHFWTIRAFLPDMLEDDYGHIVTVSSLAGKFGTIPRLTDYCASKYAAVGLTECLDCELRSTGNTGVKTTLICPFFIDTGFIHGITIKHGDDILKKEEVANLVVDAILREKRECMIPFNWNLKAVLKTLLPFQAQNVLEKFFAINVRSQSAFRH